MRRMYVQAVLASTIALTLLTAVHAQEKVADRKGYFPNRKSVELKGTAIGILLTDGQPILSTEGRSGPADQLVFSADGNSYRWVYVPTQDNPLITNLQVPLPNNQKAVYAALNMANPRSVIPWAVTQPYSLVEVEVNGGRGSPAIDSFVGTSFKVLDGSKDFPLKVVDVIKQVKDHNAQDSAKNKEAIDTAMNDGAKKALNGKAPTGPRETKDLMYVTWMNETSTMRVAFKTTISDGAYTFVGGGVNPRDPPPLPLPPKKIKVGALAAEPLIARVAPKNMQYKVGTTFGIEFGRAYIIDKKGEIVRVEELPIEPFTQQLAPPPGVGPGPGPRPLPLPLPPPPKQDQ